MGKILDLIVGNTYIFICVIGVLVAILVAIILSIVKSLNKHKIPIYEEINENIELENAKEENIIEKPTKKKAKKEQTEEKVEEVETPVESEFEEVEDVEAVSKDEEQIEVEEEQESDEKSEDEVEETLEDEAQEEAEPEFDDEALREELEKIDDKEIEERIDEEHKKNIDEEIKDNDNEELKEILSEMKDTNEVNPEEVVRNFEEEQEAQSIISYQELVNVVKNRENEFDDELESKPLTTVSDFIKKDKKSTTEPEANVLDMIEQLDKAKKQIKEEEIEELEANDEDLEELEVLEKVEVKSKKETKKEVEEETLSEIPEEGRFKKTDVISPVFGRIKEKNKIDYPKVEKFDRKKSKTVKNDDELDEELLSSIIPDFDNIELKQSKKHSATKAEIKAVSDMFDSITETIEEQETKVKEIKAGNDDKKTEDDESIESLSAISKNEDFLKALRDFRNSL